MSGKIPDDLPCGPVALAALAGRRVEDALVAIGDTPTTHTIVAAARRMGLALEEIVCLTDYPHWDNRVRAVVASNRRPARQQYDVRQWLFGADLDQETATQDELAAAQVLYKRGARRWRGTDSPLRGFPAELRFRFEDRLPAGRYLLDLWYETLSMLGHVVALGIEANRRRTQYGGIWTVDEENREPFRVQSLACLGARRGAKVLGLWRVK